MAKFEDREIAVSTGECSDIDVLGVNDTVVIFLPALGIMMSDSCQGDRGIGE